MLFLGNASGHDFQFHIASWMDAAGQWREGIAYPRWAEWANWGFGEPRFVFYPPGSWMAGAALGTLLPWRLVPGVFIWLALVAAGMSMWKLARQWLPGRTATLAAVLFALNPYNLVIVYYRSDFAELMATAFLPWMIWGALRVASGEWRKIPQLAAAFAGVWLCNAPAAVIATYSLALVLVVACAARKEWRGLVFGGVAMAGGFGLAAAYMLPAVREQRWVQIGQAVADNLGFAHNFLFAHASDPDFVAFNRKVSYVAVAMIFTAAIGSICAARRRRDFGAAFWTFATLGLASIILMLPFTNFIWQHAPELRFVQFPWRWLDILAVAYAFFIAAAIAQVRRRQVVWAAAIAVFAALVAGAVAMVRTAWWDTADVPSIAASIASGGGYRGTDEYDPIGCDRYELPGDPDDDERVEGVSATPAPPVQQLDTGTAQDDDDTEMRVTIERWSAERREFSVEAGAPATLAIRLLIYPAWDVRVDGAKVQPGAVHDNGQMLISIPTGRHRIDARFRRTLDRAVGGWISALSALVLLGFAGISRRSPKS
jgi:hypothetical protein